ncbi:MAG: hypothetical protein M5U28_40355 [Sandaracinaceae bacterium]|nr:hypothetical protein [Sandaracinaceae bacterium]
MLRGEPIEGNALEAQLEAMGGFRGLETAGFEGLGALLASGGEPPPELRALARENAEAIARYRASAQRTFAWGDAHPEAGLAGPAPDWLPHVRAGRVVLLSALGRSPRECLEIGADVLRLGQDRAAGTGLVPLMILAAHAADVLALTGRCLREADGEALASAARELAILARHPAPAGTALESEALFLGVALRDEERLSPSFPTDSLGWERWVQSWDRLEAWELLMGEPASLRALGADYPDDIDLVERRQRDLADRNNDVIAIGMPDYARFLRRDARDAGRREAAPRRGAPAPRARRAAGRRAGLALRSRARRSDDGAAVRVDARGGWRHARLAERQRAGPRRARRAPHLGARGLSARSSRRGGRSRGSGPGSRGRGRRRRS